MNEESIICYHGTGHDRWDLTGRTAVVTGAGGVIGSAVVETLVSAGAHVVATDLSLDAAAHVTGPLTGANPVALDVTDAAAVQAVADGVLADRDRLDIWCNIAGIAGTPQTVAEMTDDAFDRIFDTHLMGTLNGCRAAMSVMRPAAAGAIVNMSSEAVDIHPPTVGAYAVAKAAISMLTRVLSVEVADVGVRVNAVAPSFVPSDLSLGRIAGDDAEQERAAYLEWWRRKSPLRELCGPQDIASQIHYLVSDASAFVTGQTLRTNGGITMPW